MFSLTKSINYTIVVQNNLSGRILIDSLVILPHYQGTQLYQQGDEQEKEMLSRCWNDSIPRGGPRSIDCYGIVFSSTVELFNGTLGKMKLSLNFVYARRNRSKAFHSASDIADR